MIIYKTTNKINRKVYVGKDSKSNPDYFGSGILLQKAIKKYSKENFTKEVIDLTENEEDLNEKERYWIRFYNCKVPNGYNLTDGGDGTLGFFPNEESRKKMSEAGKRKIFTEEHRRKLSINNVAKREEEREIRRYRILGNNNPSKREDVREKMRGPRESMRGEYNPNYKAKSFTEETKKKISSSLKARKELI